MSRAGSQARSQKSQMSEARRERLVDIQKREQLKGMLISKFKLKYGDKPTLNKYIDNEVTRFMKNGRLNEDNLRQLDGKISKEAVLRERKDAILDDRKSQRSASQKAPSVHRAAAAANDDDKKSVRSITSSRQNSQGPRELNRRNKDFDQLSQLSSQDARTEVFSELAEDDEWAAIQKFNTLLHYEEQKQAIVREQERRRLIKYELDRQIQEKEDRKKEEIDERRMYEKLQEEHVKLLGQREIEKTNAQREKIRLEKESRDRQLQDEKRRKKFEQKEEFQQEVELVQRLQSEMDHKRRQMMEKRAQQQISQKMLAENEYKKKKMLQTMVNEKAQDLNALLEYGRMLDKQEYDRQREFEQRERRAQEFMNNLASKVMTKQQARKTAEDEALARYEYERELRLRIEDERRAAVEAREKQKMRDLLARQMDEKRQREAFEKAHNDEQAMIWKKDKENYEEEERRLRNKIAGINHENCEFLRRQMDEKASRQNARRMNREEVLMNKPLLKEINKQRKESQYDGVSAGQKESL